MTREQFRRMALRLPGCSEQSHRDHPDFRVGGRIFATLDYPSEGWAMVKLLPEQQAHFVAARPDCFLPVKGNWGRRGCTNVLLKAIGARELKPALEVAWRNAAPKGTH
jgi:hypothetical protein